MAQSTQISDTIDPAVNKREKNPSIQRAVGPIAQSVEQRTFNPWVDGSSPSGPTKPFVQSATILERLLEIVCQILMGKSIFEIRIVYRMQLFKA